MSVQHIFVGLVPQDVRSGDELMVTVFDSGEARIAFRLPGGDSWDAPYALTPRPTE